MPHATLYTRRGALGLLAAGAFLLVGCGERSTSIQRDDAIATPPTLVPGQLKVANDLAYPPMVIEQGDGDRTGFGYSVCEDVGELLGLAVADVPLPSQADVIAAVQAGDVADLGATSFELGALPDDVVACNATMACNLVAVDHNGQTRVDDADDLRTVEGEVLVQDCTVARDWAERELEPGGYQLLEDPEEILQAVREDRAAVGVVEEPTALYLLESLYTTLVIVETIETDWSYGFIVRAEDQELLAAVNEALADLSDDGTLASLETRWFGSALS